MSLYSEEVRESKKERERKMAQHRGILRKKATGAGGQRREKTTVGETETFTQCLGTTDTQEYPGMTHNM